MNPKGWSGRTSDQSSYRTSGRYFITIVTGQGVVVPVASKTRVDVLGDYPSTVNREA